MLSLFKKSNKKLTDAENSVEFKVIDQSKNYLQASASKIMDFRYLQKLHDDGLRFIIGYQSGDMLFEKIDPTEQFKDKFTITLSDHE